MVAVHYQPGDAIPNPWSLKLPWANVGTTGHKSLIDLFPSYIHHSIGTSFCMCDGRVLAIAGNPPTVLNAISFGWQGAIYKLRGLWSPEWYLENEMCWWHDAVWSHFANGDLVWFGKKLVLNMKIARCFIPELCMTVSGIFSWVNLKVA